MRGVPILMYHQVSSHSLPGFEKYTVAPRAFAAQMRWLTRTGYRSVSLDALLAARAGGPPLPHRAVVITFDDGFAECVEHGVPVLRALGLTATYYLVAGLMGGVSSWLRADRGVELPLIGWSTARELCAAGFTCGAHTVSHPRLVALAPEARREEVRASREMLEDGLGHAVHHMAYPYGSYDAAVREAAADAGFRSAASVRIGLSGATDDPLALHRVPVTGHDSLPDFVCRLRTGHAAGELLRRNARGALRGLRRVLSGGAA